MILHPKYKPIEELYLANLLANKKAFIKKAFH